MSKHKERLILEKNYKEQVAKPGVKDVDGLGSDIAALAPLAVKSRREGIDLRAKIILAGRDSDRLAEIREDLIGLLTVTNPAISGNGSKK